MNNSAGVLGVARPHSRDGLAFAGIARAHLAHGGCDLYVRHIKIWISQGADWISTASGSERPLAKAPLATARGTDSSPQFPMKYFFDFIFAPIMTMTRQTGAFLQLQRPRNITSFV